ncbi:GntR family transcriptional regulator [Umezawaea sp. Da 62-37]|uniref:GntR family transcriptional regulator n=1 Tax=Umezawaea sp. Da 62-37 TaxID=3075927 RepID=UPI0028F6E6A6|nr:GntR family transcriptional regulator [Umezawaea sp. Da 62-37]WNV83013.1 GntR family transcriptional regulator [Umezawaea sp. Da 62-37]
MAVPATGVRPIETRSVADQVTTELRRSILCGSLQPGREFSLREIAGMLNVSFIPVREALKNLESEGLVITRPGRSALVAPLDLDDLHAIYRLRRTIEPEIAGRACLLLPDGEFDRLDRLSAGFGDEHLGMDEIYDAHHEFHMALLAPAASAWDVRLLGTLWRAAERYIRIGFGALDPDPDEHLRREEAHGTLVDVFRRRDPEVAAQAVREHLERNEQLALRALGDQPTSTPGPAGKQTVPRGPRARRAPRD